MSEHALVLPIISAPPAPAPVRRRRRVAADPVEVPRLSVVIVNYCQWENTVTLVRQIMRTPAARRGSIEVVVVDNHSPPHPLAARLRRWPGVSLRRWGKNRGFARAVNEGCRLSRGGWFLLLNPDMTLTDGFLEGTLAVADQIQAGEPQAGIVGFQLLNKDGTRQLSAGLFPTLCSTLAGLLLPRARRKYRSVPANQRSQIPWVSGCCLLLRRDCVQQLGGLDASFFLYYEDVDLCQRAQAHGWSVWYEPQLRAIHNDPVHQRDVPPALRMITRHSLLTYCQRYWPGWQFGLLAGIVGVEACVRGVFARCRRDTRSMGILEQMGHMARELWRGNDVAAWARLRGILQAGDPRNVSPAVWHAP